MVKVKALRPHDNSYGDKVHKAKDAEYELPDNMVGTLTDAGLVAVVEEKAAKTKAE